MIKSLKSRESILSKKNEQIKILAEAKIRPFKDSLSEINVYPLLSGNLEIMQINLGYMCNQTCSHCHVDAGPDRKEIMSQQVMTQCLKAMDLSTVHTVDLTGGAPEMNPHFKWFVGELTKRNKKVIVRSNLTILVANKKYREYPQFFKDNGVTVTASLPCYTEENTDTQRGEGVFKDSLQALKILNALGYGKQGTNLALNLVYNPGGPSVAPDQKLLEADYKRILWDRYGIEFNNLYTITNLPIARYLDYLLVIGQYQVYMDKLLEAFNPSAVKGVMCKNTLSVAWDGGLYDCDFNQMLGMPIGVKNGNHISDFQLDKIELRSIAIGNHCYGCTAGAGSSCQGAIL